MVKANVDKIIDVLREKKTSTPGDLSKTLGLPKEDIQQTLDYLAEEGTVKVDKKFTGTKVTLLKDPQTQQLPPGQTPPMPQSMPKPPMPAQQSRIQNVSSPGDLPKPPVPSQTNQISQPPQILVGQAQQDTPPVPPQNLTGQQTQPDAPQPTQVSTPPAPLISEKTEQTSQKTSENFPFLIGESDQKEKQNVSSSRNLRDQPKPAENPHDENPLELHPRFDMDAPTPDGSTSSISLKPVETYTQDVLTKYETFPDIAKTSIDKIEYLMDLLEKKFQESDYKDLNVVYKRIHRLFSESEELSPNERNLLAKRINEVYDRIRTIYLVESQY